MAAKPLPTPLPANLPEDWTTGQIVAPTGEEVGEDSQYGYNFLMERVNDLSNAINTINNAFGNISGGFYEMTQRSTVSSRQANTLYGLIIADFGGAE